MRRVHLVTDGAGWSFDHDTAEIIAGLSRFGRPATASPDPGAPAGAILHFWDRYRFLASDHGALARRHPLVLTWFHGDPEDPDFADLYAQLRPALPSLSRVVTSCRLSARALVRGGVPAERVSVVPLGIDTGVFRPPRDADRRDARSAIGVGENAFVVASVQKDGAGFGAGTEPKPAKGPDILVESLRLVAADVPEVSALLVGPARGYVRDRLSGLGVAHRHVSYERQRDVAEAYRAADAVLIGSRVEGGPKAALEAWAGGVPLVSTRVGMVADLGIDGVNALLADVDDAGALARGLRRIAREPALGSRLAAAGRRTAAGLGWARVAGGLERRVYARLDG